MPLESDSSWLTLAGPYPMLPRFSGVDCPSVLPRQLLLFASLLSSRNCLLSCPATNSLSASRRQLSFASLYHFRIRRDFMSKNPLSGFAPKQTIESSALTAQPHSATLYVWSNFSFLHNSQFITMPTQSCLVFSSFSFFCKEFDVVHVH